MVINTLKASLRVCFCFYINKLCMYLDLFHRTNTIIIVHGNGEGRYVERTIVEPIDITNPKWSVTTIPFTMGEQHIRSDETARPL